MKKAILYLVHAVLALIMLVGFFLGILGGALGSLAIAVVIAFYFAIRWQKAHRAKEVDAQ